MNKKRKHQYQWLSQLPLILLRKARLPLTRLPLARSRWSRFKSLQKVRLSMSQMFLLIFSIMLGGCASYSVTEQEMTDYLHDNVSFNQSVGVENLMYAQVSVTDLAVKIGRSDADRVAVFANTVANVQLFDSPKQRLDLDLEFSAVPHYDAKTGEVFLQSIRLEQFTENGTPLPADIKRLIKPAVSMIGYGLSQKPVYKLDSHVLQEALIKSAEPNLVIRDNKLVIELFD